MRFMQKKTKIHKTNLKTHAYLKFNNSVFFCLLFQPIAVILLHLHHISNEANFIFIDIFFYYFNDSHGMNR